MANLLRNEIQQWKRVLAAEGKVFLFFLLCIATVLTSVMWVESVLQAWREVLWKHCTSGCSGCVGLYSNTDVLLPVSRLIASSDNLLLTSSIACVAPTEMPITDRHCSVWVMLYFTTDYVSVVSKVLYDICKYQLYINSLRAFKRFETENHRNVSLNPRDH